mmetsp:Transcript_90065/g.253997  ORF Transcript_90065/g.253997 Transcript_90065/m.253997 type:complete len:735 (+) Transcript_90065:63-2267(+)
MACIPVVRPAKLAVVCILVASTTRLGDALREKGRRESQTVTPVQKVVKLLEELQEHIASEGKTEAVEYDRFACFCKEQGSFKQYAIEKSESKIEKLQATIQGLDAEVADLNGEIVTLNARIGAITADHENETASSSAAHSVYLGRAKNLTDAIAAIQGAIDSLKTSKGDLKRAKLDLEQLRVVAVPRLSAIQLAMFSRVSANNADSQAPPAYMYNSNEIIGTLTDLLASFKRSKKELDEGEFQRQAMADKAFLAFANERKFKRDSVTEKGRLVASKSQSRHEAEADRVAEVAARDADKAFQVELVAQCQSKANEFDQRSKVRSGELTALAEAVQVLKTGVAPKYGANRKLVGLQIRAMGQKRELLPSAVPTSALALLQTSAVEADDEVAQKAILQRALASLDATAARLRSPVLSAMAMKVAMQEDNFVKVRGLIKDLISKLEADSLAEATSKSFCDQEMGKAVASRDEQKLAMEAQTTIISAKNAEKTQLTQEIATLAQEIADLSKGLNEATELRAGEKANNQKTVTDAGVGKAEIERAIAVLQEFYDAQGGAPGSVVLLGVGGAAPAPAPASYTPYVAPGSDREGFTVTDRAPTLSYSGDYAGKLESATGVIGLLHVILSDFDRTVTVVGAEETAAQSQFEKFQSDTEVSITAKNVDKGLKETAVVSAVDAIVQAKDALEDARGLHEGALKELEKLQAMCVEGEESWEERKAQREKEIEALKQALTILDEWQA